VLAIKEKTDTEEVSVLVTSTHNSEKSTKLYMLKKRDQTEVAVLEALYFE